MTNPASPQRPKSTRRRKFLLGGVASIAVLGGGLAYPLLRRNQPQIIGEMLHGLLPDMRIEPEELAAFTEEFIEFYKMRNPFRRDVFLWGVRTIWSYLPNGGLAVVERNRPDAFGRFENEMLQAFLMGTNYLEVRHDPAQSVSFFFMPDPYEIGCPNIFARFD